MPILLGSSTPTSVQPEPSTGNIEIAPATGGEVNINDENGDTQLSVTSSETNVSNSLVVPDVSCITTGQQSIALGNGGTTDGFSGISWRVGNSTSARSGNYRCQMGYNYDNTRFEFKVGNNSNPASLNTFMSIDSGGQTSVNGSPVLTQVNITTNIGSSTFENVPNAATVKAQLDLKPSLAVENDFTEQQTITTDSKIQVVTKGTTLQDLSGIGHIGSANNNFRAGSGYDSGTGVYFISVGSNTNFSAVPNRLEISTSSADFKVPVSHNGDAFAYANKQNENIILTNAGTGDGVLEFSNTAANTDEKRYKFVATAAETLLLRSMDDSGSTVSEWAFSHDGTTDFPEPITVQNRSVLEEGNWALIQKSVRYVNSVPSLSSQDIISWSGRKVYFFGVGSDTINLPSIVSSNPSSSQFEDLETFTVFNFNTSSDITFNAASGQKFVVDNVSSGNVSAAGGSFTVAASSRVIFTAVNLNGLSTANAFSWAVTGY